MRNLGKRKVIIMVAILLIMTFLGNIVVSFAVSTNELERQRQENQQNINNAEAEKDKIEAQMSTIQKEVEELNSKISNYESEIDDLTDQIAETSEKINTAQAELDKTQKDLEEKEELLEKRLVASYKAGETTYLDFLLSSENLTTFLSNYYLIEELAKSDTELINTIKETKERIEKAKKDLEDSKLKLEDAKKTQELKKSSLDVTKREKNQKMSQLSDEEKELQKKIDSMRAQDSAIKAAIKRAQQQSASAQKPSVKPGGYIYPVPAAYAKITTGLYYSSGSYHGAVDFGSGGIAGQPVYAVKAGTVILTQALTYSYGNYIIIDHHDGTFTLYAHGQAGSICVSQGQTVSQGQQIMRVGSTGNSTGPHLHFEVRVAPGGYNNRVNPMNYL